MKPNLEFPDFLEVEQPEGELPDAFSKFLESTTLAGTISGPHAHRLIHNFQIAAEERDKPIAKAYRKIFTDGEAKIAAASAKNNPPAPATSHTLAKNFSVSDKAGYRVYFRERIAKGESAQQVLDAWRAAFPHANPDCDALMAVVAAEFA